MPSGTSVLETFAIGDLLTDPTDVALRADAGIVLSGTATADLFLGRVDR